METNTVLRMRIGKHLVLPEKHVGRYGEGEDGVFDGGTCLICGCGEFRPCPEGCGWMSDDRNLCTACAERVLAIVGPAYRCRLLAETVIRGEENPNVLALALNYATGDWRRSLIRWRMGELAEAARQCAVEAGEKTEGEA